jgi:hypothetical protein
VANPEHIELLLAGTEAVRAWRVVHPQQQMDLTNADLSRIQLGGADLRNANFDGAALNAAVLTGANLTDATASGANLRGARLERADLRGMDLSNAYLKGADFSSAKSGATIWNSRELAQTVGLDEIVHVGRSFIDVDTVMWSAGDWPISFLRGCGLPENFIASLSEFSNDAMRFERSLLWFTDEYSDFGERLIRALRQRGVRCWPANLSASGESRDDRKMRVGCTDVLIVCVSGAAIDNPQVETAVRSALAREVLPAGVLEPQRRLLTVLDLDGALDGDGPQGGLPELADRVVGKFVGSATEGDAFQEGVDQVVRSLTIPRTTNLDVVPPVASGIFMSESEEKSEQAQTISLDELEQLPGQTAGLFSGFRRLLQNDGGNSVWFDYRGQKQPTHHLRQLSADNVVEWETGLVPPGFDDSLACFVWAGSFGAFDEPQSDGFGLSFNGEDQLVFDLTRTTQLWRNSQDTVVLMFDMRWSSADDVAGFFYLGVSPELVTQGKSCRVGIRTLGVDSERWVGLIPITDSIERQATNVSD